MTILFNTLYPHGMEWAVIEKRCRAPKEDSCCREGRRTRILRIARPLRELGVNQLRLRPSMLRSVSSYSGVGQTYLPQRTPPATANVPSHGVDHLLSVAPGQVFVRYPPPITTPYTSRSVSEPQESTSPAFRLHKSATWRSASMFPTWLDENFGWDLQSLV